MPVVYGLFNHRVHTNLPSNGLCHILYGTRHDGYT
ncbi:hypothetical protein J529_4534, partial [Acinetobacter baumannii 99063]